MDQALIRTILKEKALKPSERVLICWLLLKENQQGQCLTQRTTANTIGLSFGQVNRAIHAMVKMNIVESVNTGRVHTGWRLKPVSEWRLGRVRKVA